MATIQKRKDSYSIIVSCGYDVNNRQIRRSMTFKPELGMTEKQIEKEVKRQAVLFEENCRKGILMDGNIKFADFSEEWMKHKKNELRPKTYAGYKNMLPRINAAVGHLRIDRIQPQHLLSFYEGLSEGGIRKDTKYKCNIDINKYLEENCISITKLASRAGLPFSSVASVRDGNNCTFENAEKLCKGMNMELEDAFEPININKPLSSKTVLHHHRLISSILSTAVEWGVILSNPCDITKAPRLEKKEPKYLDEFEAAKLLELLENERIDYRTMIRVLLFTGLRRGELLGLQWGDVDFKNSLLKVQRSSLYLPDRGIFDDETKTATSYRVIKLPLTTLDDLKIYKQWQDERKLELGDRWHDSNKIFTSDDGKPLHPDTLSSWFSKFIKAHGDELPKISIHSLRHTNASLQIAGGVPLTTVAKRLGHSNTATTSRIYAHAIQSADEAAAQTIESLLKASGHCK